MGPLIDLNELRLLMQVIEQGSFTRASQVLGIPKSTISQRISRLERRAGIDLLRRSAGSFSVTEAGEKLLPHARSIEAIAKLIELSIAEQADNIVGRLRLSCTTALAGHGLATFADRFLDANPKVTFAVEACSRLVDLVGEGFDIVIREHRGQLKDSSLRQRVVGRSSWFLAASPDWVKTHILPEQPQDLRDGAILFLTSSIGPSAWTLRHGDRVQEVRAAPHMASDDMVVLSEAAAANGGIVCLPGYVLRPQFRSGALVPVFRDWSPEKTTISVLTPPKPQSSQLASAFAAHLAAEVPVMNGGA